MASESTLNSRSVKTGSRSQRVDRRPQPNDFSRGAHHPEGRHRGEGSLTQRRRSLKGKTRSSMTRRVVVRSMETICEGESNECTFKPLPGVADALPDDTCRSALSNGVEGAAARTVCMGTVWTASHVRDSIHLLRCKPLILWSRRWWWCGVW